MKLIKVAVSPSDVVMSSSLASFGSLPAAAPRQVPGQRRPLPSSFIKPQLYRAQSRPENCRPALCQALPTAEQVSEVVASPGSVDAPIWAIVLATVAVTAALGLSSFLFKPGFDASAKMQERDRQSGRFK